jgi:hypothetical protein
MGNVLGHGDLTWFPCLAQVGIADMTDPEFAHRWSILCAKQDIHIKIQVRTTCRTV